MLLVWHPSDLGAESSKPFCTRAGLSLVILPGVISDARLKRFQSKRVCASTVMGMNLEFIGRLGFRAPGQLSEIMTNNPRQKRYQSVSTLLAGLSELVAHRLN